MHKAKFKRELRLHSCETKLPQFVKDTVINCNS